MRRLIIGGLAGAAVAVAGLAGWQWAAGPAVYQLPGADPASPTYIAAAPTAGPAARWLVVAQPSGRFWRFDHHSGRLAGPWAMPPDADAEVDATGLVHFLPARYWEPADRLVVRRHDPATDTCNEVWGRADVLRQAQWVTAPDGTPVLAVATGGPGRPLRVEVVDLFTGAVRSVLDFPDRTGTISCDEGEAEAAASGWRVSDDGTRLALGERLRGGKPTGPPGLELWDLATGKRVRTLDTGDRWAINPVFTDDGRAVWSEIHPRTGLEPYTSDTPRWYWDCDTGQRLTESPYLHDPPDSTACWVEKQSDGLILWRGNVDVAGVYERFRVTAADGRPSADWVTVPADWVLYGGLVDPEFAPGTSSIVFVGDNKNEMTGWEPWLKRQVGLQQDSYPTTVTWYNWQSGSIRRVRTYRPTHGSASVRVQTGWLTVAVSDYYSGRHWLEVWPTPPPVTPPLWLWPVAAVAGGLAGWAIRRRPTSTRAGTASTGSS